MHTRCVQTAPVFCVSLQGSKEALELYVSTLSSGALDRTIALGKDAMAVTALIAIHHLSKALAASVTVRGKETLEASASSQRIEAPTRNVIEGAVLPGLEGPEKDAQKRMVHRLGRNLLLGVAHGTCESVSMGKQRTSANLVDLHLMALDARTFFRVETIIFWWRDCSSTACSRLLRARTGNADFQGFRVRT